MALAETDPQASIEALIALARLGDKSLQPQIIAALGRLDFSKLPKDLHLPYLRAWQLVFTRMGKPAPEICQKIAARLDPLFPNTDAFVNRELASLLVFLDSPTIVGKTRPAARHRQRFRHHRRHRRRARPQRPLLQSRRRHARQPP